MVNGEIPTHPKHPSPLKLKGGLRFAMFKIVPKKNNKERKS